MQTIYSSSVHEPEEGVRPGSPQHRHQQTAVMELRGNLVSWLADILSPQSRSPLDVVTPTRLLGDHRQRALMSTPHHRHSQISITQHTKRLCRLKSLGLPKLELFTIFKIFKLPRLTYVTHPWPSSLNNIQFNKLEKVEIIPRTRIQQLWQCPRHSWFYNPDGPFHLPPPLVRRAGVGQPPPAPPLPPPRPLPYIYIYI